MRAAQTAQRPEPAPSLSPARGVLAERIAELAALTRRQAELDAAHVPGGLAAPAREKLDAAAATLAQARADGAARLIGRVVEGPVASIATLRAELADAEEHLALAEQAQAVLDAEARALPDAIRRMRDRVSDAAVAVLREEGATATAMLIADIGRIQGELIDKVGALRWLRTTVLSESEVHHAVTMAAHGMVFGGIDGALGRALAESPTAAVWRGAYEALQRDADAVVPEG